MSSTTKDVSKLSTYLVHFGLLLLAISILLFLLIFHPVITEEVKYNLRSKTDLDKAIVPSDTDFGIVIPKIKANAAVIKNVDPYNANVYQRQLTKGVAHARGSALPGRAGNVFLFAHSSDNFYNANRYNSVFYLLNKLEKDDEIDLYFEKKKYQYRVSAKKIVAPTAIAYLKGSSFLNKLTLMTCWPPGTTLKRLIITGELRSD